MREFCVTPPRRLGLQPKVNAGAFQRAMPKQIADRLDANPALKQSHGDSVAEALGRAAIERPAALPRAHLGEPADRVML